ncbi:MAG: hypothetical protein GXX96_11425 [Planctomycetaceae bacterium]|jgi:hypothetical protein|nr:hypothetical protein [Planctomycetaceae bacterium]
MSNDTTAPSGQRRRWFQFRLRTLFVTFTLVALVLGLLIHYRVHLVWCYTSSHLGLADVPPVPVTSMPEVEVPEDWVACRFGSLHLRLPRELIRNLQGSPGGGMIALRDNPRAMLIPLPAVQPDASDFLRNDLLMPPEGQELSMLMLRVACLQTGSDEFRWSMSPHEVRWFTWRMTIGRLFRTGADQHAETVIRDDLEGVVCYRSGYAEFFWQSKEGPAGGVVTLIDQSQEEVDPAWVRAVCRSVSCTGESCSRPRSKEEVEAQFEIIAE